MRTLTIALFFLMAFNGFSQDKNHIEHIKSLKVAFITERLNLSQSEAQKFWPIFNGFEEKRRNLIINEKEKLKQIDNDLTDAEAKKLLNDLLKIEEKNNKLKNDYYKDLLTVVSAKKVLLLQKSEEDFKRQIFAEFKKRKEKK